MRFSVRLAAMTAVCTLPATMALAQGQDGASSGNMGERSPDQITCADITAMDTRLVPGVLYYISGYQEGSRAGMAGGSHSAAGTGSDLTTITGGSEIVGGTGSDSSPTTSDSSSGSGGTTDQTTASGSGTTTSSASGSDTSSSGTSGSDSSASATSGTDASSTGGSPATASNGNAASASSGDSASATTGSSDATSGGDQASASGSGSGGSMNVVRVTGMFEIPVEQVMVVCGQSPDMTASDAVEQNRGSSDGSSSSSTN